MAGLKKTPMKKDPDLDLKRGSQFVGPLYDKVKTVIKEKITTGAWVPEFRIPSEYELVEALKVSRMTINRALRELTAEGYLIRIQGVGTFVAKQKPRSAVLEVKSLSEEVEESGGMYSCQVHLLEATIVPADLIHFMGLPHGSTIYRSIIAHKDRNIPIQYDERFINPRLFPDFLKQDYTKVYMGEYLESVVPFTEAEQIIEALMPDREIRRVLKMGTGEPCLVVNRTTWVDNLVATKARFFHPGNRYRIGGIIRQ